MRGPTTRVLVLRVSLQLHHRRLERRREGIVRTVVREQRANARAVKHDGLAILRLVEVVHLRAGGGWGRAVRGRAGGMGLPGRRGGRRRRRRRRRRADDAAALDRVRVHVLRRGGSHRVAAPARRLRPLEPFPALESRPSGAVPRGGPSRLGLGVGLGVRLRLILVLLVGEGARRLHGFAHQKRHRVIVPIRGGHPRRPPRPVPAPRSPV